VIITISGRSTSQLLAQSFPHGRTTPGRSPTIHVRQALTLQRQFLVSTPLILRRGAVSSVPSGVLPHESCDRTGHVREVPLQY
jgi:hypothetical protein